MILDIRYANHPDDSKKYDTDELRKHYLIESVFEAETIRLTYSHQDRMIAGGAMPLRTGLGLQAGKEFGTEFFLERRELGVINTGGPGSITLDGKEYGLESRDGMYIGMGIAEVILKSSDPGNPAKFYLEFSPGPPGLSPRVDQVQGRQSTAHGGPGEPEQADHLPVHPPESLPELPAGHGYDPP